LAQALRGERGGIRLPQIRPKLKRGWFKGDMGGMSLNKRGGGRWIRLGLGRFYGHVEVRVEWGGEGVVWSPTAHRKRCLGRGLREKLFLLGGASKGLSCNLGTRKNQLAILTRTYARREQRSRVKTTRFLPEGRREDNSLRGLRKRGVLKRGVRQSKSLGENRMQAPSA